MSVESLEQRIKNLEETLEKSNRSLKQEVEYLRAVHEISNLFGKQRYMGMAGLQEEQVELYSKDANTRIY